MATFIPVSPVHQENAQPPMEVTLLGIATLVSPVQPWNALSPMEATGKLAIVFGIVTLPPLPL